MQFTQPATMCSIGPLTRRSTQLPGLTTRERFKNSMSGLVAKITTFNILIKFDGT